MRPGLPRGAVSLAIMTSGDATLGYIQGQVEQALKDFLQRQRPVLLGASDELLPGLDALSALLAGGKRLRPAFCYWGWRGAGGEDCPQILTAAAALELLHASALVHDDVMDGSDSRRGQPALHRQFAALERLRAVVRRGRRDPAGRSPAGLDRPDVPGQRVASRGAAAWPAGAGPDAHRGDGRPVPGPAGAGGR